MIPGCESAILLGIPLRAPETIQVERTPNLKGSLGFLLSTCPLALDCFHGVDLRILAVHCSPGRGLDLREVIHVGPVPLMYTMRNSYV